MEKPKKKQTQGWDLHPFTELTMVLLREITRLLFEMTSKKGASEEGRPPHCRDIFREEVLPSDSAYPWHLSDAVLMQYSTRKSKLLCLLPT